MAKKELIANDAVTLRVNEAAVDAVENVVDNVVNVADLVEGQVERVVTVTKNNPLLIAGALVVGATVGGFIAYKIAAKRAEKKFEELLREEVAAAKEYHTNVTRSDYATPAEAVQKLIPDAIVETTRGYQGKPGHVAYDRIGKDSESEPLAEKVEVQVTETSVNVFVDSVTDPTEWDYSRELANRDPDRPYVVSFEEYSENEEGHDQDTLQYYADDDVLCKMNDVPFEHDIDTFIGDDNLLRFGAGSHDRNVVYVRNEKIEQDWEILRIPKSYHQDVLGTEPPTTDAIRHSHRPRRGRDADA